MNFDVVRLVLMAWSLLFRAEFAREFTPTAMKAPDMKGTHQNNSRGGV